MGHDSACSHTGDAVTDFVLEAGPRTFGADLPLHVREEIGKSPALGWYRRSLKCMKQLEIARMHKAIEQTSRENRQLEKELKATNGIGLPECRIPMDVHFQMQDLWGPGCWKDEEFRQDFLKHHPGLRLNVKRGTRGQEYGGAARSSNSTRASAQIDNIARGAADPPGGDQPGVALGALS